MNTLLKVGLIAGLLLSGPSFAAENITRADQIPQLHEDPQDPTVSERVTSRFTRSHYRQFDLDGTFSAKIFDRYLNMLDYSHNVLLASDVAQFASKKAQLGDELRSGKLDIFYDLYNLAQKRRFERYQYALTVLARPMNFSGNDTIDIDRAKAPWPKDQSELNALWDAKVKYDELSLKLAGKDEKEIREVLTKRYNFAIRRLAQSNSEDVFQLAMNSFAHEIDPHTNYLSPRNTEQFNTEMSLSLEGIGAVLQIVIDLRTNGGGALTEAVSLSGLFIPSGPVVQVRDNNGHVRQDSDNDGIVYYKGPLVVLVDRFSASASEIFAAAMQDYGRALIVGEPTFGKGTVQQYRSLNRIYDQMLRPEWPALGSVQYTIQKFYRINGGSTQRKGVTPDLLMPTGVEAAETGEKFEDNALPWDSITAATYTRTGDVKALAPQLTKEHDERIAKDREFQYIMKDIARFNAMKDKRNIVSLNLAQREKENHEEDALRLERINARYQAEGKKPLKSLDDLPKDYKEPDPYLDETVKIANDLAQLEKSLPDAPAAKTN